MPARLAGREAAVVTARWVVFRRTGDGLLTRVVLTWEYVSGPLSFAFAAYLAFTLLDASAWLETLLGWEGLGYRAPGVPRAE